MGRRPSRPPSLTIYLTLNGAFLQLAATLMARLSRAGGYSVLGLLVIAATSLLGLAALAAAILLHLRPAWELRLREMLLHRDRSARPALVVLFILLWCVVWFPPQHTGDLYYYFVGLYPLVLCALLAVGCALIYLTTARNAFSSELLAAFLHSRRPVFLIAIAALAAFGLIAILTARLRVLAGFEPYWYGAGVPLLAVQVLMALLVGLLALEFEPWLLHRHLPLDGALFGAVWIVAAIVWAVPLVPASFWVTGPRPPNFEYYPFSDPIIYDIGSQFALIGQGIYNHMFFDRALYMSFLVYLHTFGGQNYQQLMAIQAALFAVFPAVLFLIGRGLHSRTAGLILAALATMRGVNSLGASAWIDTANFKHMLTDFPTAIGVAIVTLLVLRWLASPARRTSSVLWAAGVVGLTSLLRPNALVLLPLIFGVMILVYRTRPVRLLAVAGMTLLAFFAGIAPWLVFGPSAGSVFSLYGQRLRDMVALRYPRSVPVSTPSPRPTPAGSPVPVPTAAIKPPLSAVPPTLPILPAPNPGMWFGVPQYIHNLVTASLIFPDSPEFLGIKDTVKGGEAFWLPRWDGGMSPMAGGMLVLNLAILAFGLGAVAQRRRWSGLLPLAVLLAYFAANAIARTSGGRYLVPADWILLIYYAVALAELVSLLRHFYLRATDIPELARSPDDGVPSSEWRTTATAIASLLLIGALVPLAGVVSALVLRRFAASDGTLFRSSGPGRL
jgi:hypothetical protein